MNGVVVWHRQALVLEEGWKIRVWEVLEGLEERFEVWVLKSWGRQIRGEVEVVEGSLQAYLFYVLQK